MLLSGSALHSCMPYPPNHWKNEAGSSFLGFTASLESRIPRPLRPKAGEEKPSKEDEPNAEPPFQPMSGSSGGSPLIGGEVSFFLQTFAIYTKDLQAELRNRTALNAILLFAITSLVVVSFAVAGSGLQSKALKAALLWVVLFFAAFSGLAHVFIHEEETATLITLRLSAAPGAVYVGKLLFNLTLLLVIAIVVLPLLVVILDMPFHRPVLLSTVVVSGGLGLGAGATIVAAIIAKARGKGALFGALGFPVLLPQLMMAVHATRLVMTDVPTTIIWRDIAGLLSFAVMLITASVLLFPFVWED
jgi:heme exporter protein B